jgi:hypothetical protein
MTRSTPFRFSSCKISLGILSAMALTLSPQAFAQHAGGAHASGGGGHFAAGGGGHFASGGGARFTGGATAARSAGFAAASHSYQASHTSPIHVFSGPRSAPIAAAHARSGENSAPAAITERDRAAAVQLRSSDISALSSSEVPRGLAAFADPNAPSSAAAAAARARSDARPPMHITIGFPPSADAGFISSARSRGSLNFAGQGDHLWQSARENNAANRNSVRAIVGRPPERAFPKPPHAPRRPILAGPGLFFPPAFVFSSPIFGLYGPGFGCGPSWVFPYQCGGLDPGLYGGYSYLGFGGGYGGYAGGLGDSPYGYDGGYYAPPSDFGVAPNAIDEGASQEPAPTEWQNPPGENSSPENSASDNSASDNSSAENAAPAPDTIIYLKDGTSFAVKDYWIADGQLHYVASYGGENAVDLNQLDLERTTDANAQQGIAITLRPGSAK